MIRPKPTNRRSLLPRPQRKPTTTRPETQEQLDPELRAWAQKVDEWLDQQLDSIDQLNVLKGE